MTYFDYERMAKEAGLSADHVEQLSRVVRGEFPHDDMLYELHMLRACKTVRDGIAKIDDVLHDDSLALAT